MQHIMVDLETLGVGEGAAIASLGAVAFDPASGETGREFYRIIDPRSCQRAGLRVDAATFVWWLKQSDGARQALADSGDELAEVLRDFTAWWGFEAAIYIWGFGAGFDEPLLGAAYRAVGLKTPWRYSASRCARTVLDLADVRPQRIEGEHHNALADARSQAAAMIEAYHRLGLRKLSLDDVDLSHLVSPQMPVAPAREG